MNGKVRRVAGHVPRKALGQHFLCDAAIISSILQTLHIQAHDHLVEIGPGLGALTKPLLELLKQNGSDVALDVVELDNDLIPKLEAKKTFYPQLQVHHHDALSFDFAGLKKDARALRLLGNLPYNISTPLIFHLLTFASIIQDMLFMLQKEVAERIAAPVSSEHYGRLSVMVQYHCEPQLLFDIPPEAFDPPPQVMSSIITLKPFQTYPHVAKDYALFKDVVKLAFGQRRKTLRNSLKTKVDDVMWADLSVDPKARAENVDVAGFVEISNRLFETR